MKGNRVTKMLVLGFILFWFFPNYAQQGRKTVYYFATGWEHLPKNREAKLNFQPVISNIVRINCNESISDVGVTNQLNDYYSAYFAKERGFLGLNRTVAFGPFDTWDGAEKERRQRITSLKRDWDPLLLIHFRYLCDDD